MAKDERNKPSRGKRKASAARSPGGTKHSKCATSISIIPSRHCFALLILMPLAYREIRSIHPSNLFDFNKTRVDSISVPVLGEETVYRYKQYVPSVCEKYIVDHAELLGYASENNPAGCTIWKDSNATSNECQLELYAASLDVYITAVQNFQPIPDVFDSIRKGDYRVCSATKLENDRDLRDIFSSDQLSLSKSGYIEPLTPPMRFHKFCHNRKELMSLDYLVHDFEAMCLNLKPTSRRVLIDMGASLSFHGETTTPIVTLLELYEKFGFHFDHIYAFEIKFTEPKDIFQQLLPEKYLSAYHWINTGVSSEEGNRMNPLNSILRDFNENDFIVVKLDIDTGSIEVPLAKQLLDGGNNGTYHRLIDQFYFEHHVHMQEIAGSWSSTMNGTIKDSLDLFYGLREKGIPAHFWP